ncbi:MAG TPA: DUF3224 domain-containing protein [Nitrospira sp.]|nr:DUF3224 domain-containing protein [Nitrospira sp.]
MRDHKSSRGEDLRHPNVIRIGAMAIVLIACGILVLHGIANADAEDKKAGPIQIKAHFETTPDHYDMAPPCSAWTSVPTKGTCRGLGRNTGPETITGDWQGQSEYAYGFFIFPSGHSYGSGLDHFSGTISGCGTGSVVYRAPFSSDSKGNVQGQWQMIEGSGTGGLAGLRGTGTFSQITKPDGSTVGDYSGTVYCSK